MYKKVKILSNKETKTIVNLHDELATLVKNGLGDREIYEVVKTKHTSQLLPFNKKLIIPTMLEKALISNEIDEKNHILFM